MWWIPQLSPSRPYFLAPIIDWSCTEFLVLCNSIPLSEQNPNFGWFVWNIKVVVTLFELLLCLQTYLFKLMNSSGVTESGESEKVLLLMESGVRLHTTAYVRYGYTISPIFVGLVLLCYVQFYLWLREIYLSILGTKALLHLGLLWNWGSTYAQEGSKMCGNLVMIG